MLFSIHSVQKVILHSTHLPYNPKKPTSHWSKHIPFDKNIPFLHSIQNFKFSVEHFKQLILSKHTSHCILAEFANVKEGQFRVHSP